MKKILKPLEREEVAFFSDFTGKPLDECGPDVELKVTFSYGSKYIGSQITLHLSDKDIGEVLAFLATKITKEYRKEIQKTLQEIDARYEDATDSRAWDLCYLYNSDRELYKKMLGLD